MLFGCGDQDSLLFPVHVFQTNPLDFSDTQPVNGEQEKDGTVADVSLTIRFGASQKTLYICPRRAQRKLFMLINPRAADRIADSGLSPSHLLAIPKEHSKMVSSAADSSASPTILAEKDQVPFYIRNPELNELLLFCVLEELSQALSDAFDCLR
jgi:hypothetical protein